MYINSPSQDKEEWVTVLSLHSVTLWSDRHPPRQLLQYCAHCTGQHKSTIQSYLSCRLASLQQGSSCAAELISQVSISSLLINRNPWPTKATQILLQQSIQVLPGYFKLVSSHNEAGKQNGRKSQIAAKLHQMEAMNLQVPWQIRLRFISQILTFDYCQEDSNRKFLPALWKANLSLHYIFSSSYFSAPLS